MSLPFGDVTDAKTDADFIDVLKNIDAYLVDVDDDTLSFRVIEVGNVKSLVKK